MRLGAPLFGDTSDPAKWIAELERKNYRAAFCPLKPGAASDEIAGFRRAAEEAGIVIAEVGAWSNPLAQDETERAAALEKCKGALELAEKIGARCCVNVSGSRGERWAGPSGKNFTDETVDMIVDCVREIIDAVKPGRTFYTLETMPWMYPDSVESYERLVAAIDRERFGVHFDPVNLVASPQIYARTGELIREFVARLGPRIRSCHAKDILLGQKLTVHLDEVRPGLGGLDYRVFLTELAKLEPDLPLMLEHLGGEEEYDLAATHIRGVASEAGVEL
ncbi:MAG: sugar phosphate isomerase/epimerase family protein [Planctomycetota bacterium]|jgi:sugar phosphate isomerase/epimerase